MQLLGQLYHRSEKFHNFKLNILITRTRFSKCLPLFIQSIASLRNTTQIYAITYVQNTEYKIQNTIIAKGEPLLTDFP